jgi:hypothetical protein
MIISKFARMLHAYDGSVIKMRDPNILLEVARHAAHTDNSQLKILYQRLRLELRNQLNLAIPNRAEVGSLMIHHDLYHKVKSRAENRTLGMKNSK